MEKKERLRKKGEKELARLEDLMAYENVLRGEGHCRIAGLDEAGRGPLAGPVVAGAVILSEVKHLVGLDDSKKLSPSTRQRLYDSIRVSSIAWGIGVVSARVIDEINILRATRKAMIQAIKSLKVQPDSLLIDGPIYLDISLRQFPLPGGDRRSASIAAASILAKVTRDRIMVALGRKFPQYCFSRNKGYGTSEHLQALRQYGPCPYHRRAFRPVSLAQNLSLLLEKGEG